MPQLIAARDRHIHIVQVHRCFARACCTAIVANKCQLDTAVCIHTTAYAPSTHPSSLITPNTSHLLTSPADSMEQLDNVPVPSGRRYASRSSRRLMRNDDPEPTYQQYQSAVPRPPSEASSVRSGGTVPAPPLAGLPPPIARPPPSVDARPSPTPGEDLPPEVELSIAQRAVMERYTSNLHVQFTEEQAQALEMAAVEKAMKESEREEAAMWYVRSRATVRVVISPQGFGCRRSRRRRPCGGGRPHPRPTRAAPPSDASHAIRPRQPPQLHAV